MSVKQDGLSSDHDSRCRVWFWGFSPPRRLLHSDVAPNSYRKRHASKCAPRRRARRRHQQGQVFRRPVIWNHGRRYTSAKVISKYRSRAGCTTSGLTAHAPLRSRAAWSPKSKPWATAQRIATSRRAACASTDPAIDLELNTSWAGAITHTWYETRVRRTPRLTLLRLARNAVSAADRACTQAWRARRCNVPLGVTSLSASDELSSSIDRRRATILEVQSGVDHAPHRPQHFRRKGVRTMVRIVNTPSSLPMDSASAPNLPNTTRNREAAEAREAGDSS